MQKEQRQCPRHTGCKPRGVCQRFPAQDDLMGGLGVRADERGWGRRRNRLGGHGSPESAEPHVVHF